MRKVLCGVAVLVAAMAFVAACDKQEDTVCDARDRLQSVCPDLASDTTCQEPESCTSADVSALNAFVDCIIQADCGENDCTAHVSQACYNEMFLN